MAALCSKAMGWKLWGARAQARSRSAMRPPASSASSAPESPDGAGDKPRAH